MTAPVTVVVPTKDRRSVLAVAVRSILAQRDVDVRVVVVDDGSSDDTAAWASTVDPRVEVVRHDAPMGAPTARNDGVARATTELVAFCDDDDVWAPTKLASQLRAMAATEGARWCCTGAVCVDDQLEIIDAQRLERGGDVLATVLTENLIPGGGSSVLAHTSLVVEAGGFTVGQPASEDWDLWIRLAARSPLAVVDEPLVGYRVWAGGKSRQVDRMEAAFDVIQARYGDLAAERGVRGDRRAHQRFLAKQALRAGDRRGAARRFARAGRYDRAALALVAPGVMNRVGDERMRRAVDDGWSSAAEVWLEPLRAELRAASSR
jgi:glycosyltransferase involved in cell wall biosynthesis